MEEFQLFIEQDLLNPDFQKDGEFPDPVWKIYAKANGRLFEYTKEYWYLRSGAQEGLKVISRCVGSSTKIDENWRFIK